MQQFSIKQLEKLTGIKAHTIRIWEKRYQLVSPDRSGGKHRTYTNEDLRSILRVVHLYKKGYKISSIAKLNAHEIVEKMQADTLESNRFEVIMPSLMEACIDLDGKRFRYILSEVQWQAGLEKLMLNLVFPFLGKLGDAWVSGKIFPNNEHFISHILISILSLAINELPKKGITKSNNKVLLFQPVNEMHEIPLLFLNYMLRKQGCETIYMGCNVPDAAIIDFCSVRKVTHIHYHLVTSLNDRDQQQYLEMLARLFPDVKIVASGPVVCALSTTGSNTQILRNQQEMLEYALQLA